MKKLVITLFALAALASARAADTDSYLLWMVSGSDTPAFAYASLYVDKGAGGIVAIDQYRTGVEPGSTQTSLAEVSSKITGNMDTSSVGWNYYVELLNANGEATYRSDLFAYTAIQGFIYQSPSPAPASGFNMAGGNGFSPVPEPTSGVMMLMGLALLGLKRKRA